MHHSGSFFNQRVSRGKHHRQREVIHPCYNSWPHSELTMCLNKERATIQNPLDVLDNGNHEGVVGCISQRRARSAASHGVMHFIGGRKCVPCTRMGIAQKAGKGKENCYPMRSCAQCFITSEGSHPAASRTSCSRSGRVGGMSNTASRTREWNALLMSKIGHRKTYVWRTQLAQRL